MFLTSLRCHIPGSILSSSCGNVGKLTALFSGIEQVYVSFFRTWTTMCVIFKGKSFLQCPFIKCHIPTHVFFGNLRLAKNDVCNKIRDNIPFLT